MGNLKRIFYYLAGGAVVVAPAIAFAAFNDVTLDDDITIQLGNGNTYTLTTATKVESYEVKTSSISFDMLDGSVAVFESSDRHALDVSSGCTIAASVCDANKASVTVECSSTQTITITPDTSITCDQGGSSASGLGGSDSGGSTGGGGGASTPSTDFDSTDEAEEAASQQPELVVNFTTGQPAQITVGSSGHRVTVSSATDSQVTVTVESDPITITLQKGESKDLDTDGDGVDDLRVEYVGLVGEKPQLNFVELAIAEKTESVILPEGCPSLKAGDLFKVPGLSAVYLVSPEMKRMYFPHSSVYHTWYKDFSRVVEIQNICVDSYPAPSNPPYGVNYRSGSVLVKLPISPSVYVIEPGNRLRKVGSEAVAAALYGNRWAGLVRDIADVFWPNYVERGSELTEAVPHDGMFVKETGSMDVYYVENGKRKIVEDAVVDGAHSVAAEVLGKLGILPGSVRESRAYKNPGQ